MLRAAIDALVERIEGTDEYPATEVTALLATIHHDAPSMSSAAIEELQVGIRRLERAVQDQRQRMEARLGNMQRGKRAMRGYGYLRASSAGQRLRRKV